MMLSHKIRTVLFLSAICSLFAVAFSACSGSDEPISESRPVEIIVSTGFGSASGVETRVTGSVSTERILSDGPLPLSVVRMDQVSEFDASYLPYTQTNVNGKGQAPRSGFLEGVNLDVILKFDPEELYLPHSRNNNSTKLIGWYPQVDNADGSSWLVNDGVAAVGFTVDGKTDILMSNLVEGNINNPFAGEANTLTFRHLLTRFYVRVFARSAVEAALWGDVWAVKMRGKAQSCVVTLPGVDAVTNTFPSDITFIGNNDLDIIYSDPGNPVSIPVVSGEVDSDGFLIGTTLVGYAMVAPEETAITLDVTNEHRSGSVSITAPSGGFIAGHSYTLSLEFIDTEIVLSDITITDWVNVKGEDLEIGGG